MIKGLFNSLLKNLKQTQNVMLNWFQHLVKSMSYETLKSGTMNLIQGMVHGDRLGLFTKPSMLKNSFKGFTLIEIIVVIIILSVVSAITIKFLVDSMKIYIMTANQKTLFDEGKLALERMCRDIRDAASITGSTPTSVTFTRNDATAQDGMGESIRFDLSGTTLRKVKNAGGAPENPIAMADYVSTFAVTNTASEIQLRLTLSLGTGENVTLQSRVYPKCLSEDLGVPPTYKNFRILNSAGNPIVPTWEEVRSP